MKVNFEANSRRNVYKRMLYMLIQLQSPALEVPELVLSIWARLFSFETMSSRDCGINKLKDLESIEASLIWWSKVSSTCVNDMFWELLPCSISENLSYEITALKKKTYNAFFPPPPPPQNSNVLLPTKWLWQKYTLGFNVK